MKIKHDFMKFCKKKHAEAKKAGITYKTQELGAMWRELPDKEKDKKYAKNDKKPDKKPSTGTS